MHIFYRNKFKIQPTFWFALSANQDIYGKEIKNTFDFAQSIERLKIILPAA